MKKRVGYIINVMNRAPKDTDTTNPLYNEVWMRNDISYILRLLENKGYDVNVVETYEEDE